MQDIYRRFKVEVVIETFPSIPDTMKAQYKPEEKARFFRRWAETRATDEGLKGIYVLICKNPGHLQIEPDQLVRRKAFTLDQRDALVARMRRDSWRKNNMMRPLAEIVDGIESTLETDLGQPRWRVARAKDSQCRSVQAGDARLGPVGLDLLGRRRDPGLLADLGRHADVSRRRQSAMPGGGPGGMSGGGYGGGGYGPGYGGGGGGGFLQFLGGRYFRCRGGQLDV